MVKKNVSTKTATRLTVNRDNYMDSLKKNILLYLADMCMSLNEFSEYVGVPYSTLNTIVYGSPKDVKLSTVVAIALRLGISLDELVGSATMEDKMRESIRLCRSLPDHSLYLLRYMIRHQAKIYSALGAKHKYISLIRPQLTNGLIATTNGVEPYCADSLPEDMKSKVYLGMLMPCDFYMPYYLPGEIILIAADKKAHGGERCVVTSNGGIYIVVKDRVINDGIMEWKYVPLMSQNVALPDGIIDDKLGYVVGFLNRDGSWGIR